MLRRFALTAVALLAASGLVGCGGADRQYYDPNEGVGGADASTEESGGAKSAGGSSGQGGASAGGTVGVGGDGGEGTIPGVDGGDAGGSIQDAAVDNYVPPPPVEPGRPGMDIVAWGAAMKSTNYKLVFTVGEGPGANGMMVSPNYTMVTGLVGTTQP